MRVLQEICLAPIGRVRSQVKDRAQAPKQGAETGQPATLDMDQELAPALADLAPGDHVWVLCYFHQADPPQMAVHPRGDPSRPKRSLFSTRAPNRPNPISLTLVKLVAVDGCQLTVQGLEAFDGTPVLDIKPYVPGIDAPRD